MFINEVMVKGADIILRGVSNFFELPNTTTSYNPNAKIYNLVNTSMTMSTKTQHYSRNHKSRQIMK